MSQRVDLGGFSGFLTGQRNKIAAAFKEIEELQKLYQGSYTRFKADHDKTLLALDGRSLVAREDDTSRPRGAHHDKQRRAEWQPASCAGPGGRAGSQNVRPTRSCSPWGKLRAR